jgi:hypothetical protein
MHIHNAIIYKKEIIWKEKGKGKGKGQEDDKMMIGISNELQN